jgi:hypothetical protein
MHSDHLETQQSQIFVDCEDISYFDWDGKNTKTRKKTNLFRNKPDITRRAAKVQFYVPATECRAKS